MLARKLAQDRAMPHSLWTHAGAHRVDAWLARRNRDLRAQPWLACDRADLHGAGLDLGHLRLEKAMDEGSRGPRNAHLRLPRVVLGLEDDDERGAAGDQLLTGDLLLRRHHAFDAPEVDVHRAGLDAIDDPARELASVLRDIAQVLVTLEVVDVPQHRVLGRLCSHPLEVLRGEHLDDLGAVRPDGPAPH